MATSNVTSDIWVPNEGEDYSGNFTRSKIRFPNLHSSVEPSASKNEWEKSQSFFVKRHAHHCYLCRDLAQAATPNLVAPSLEAVLMGRIG